MSTTLYLTKLTPGFTPSSFQGSWNTTVGAATGRLSDIIELDNGLTTELFQSIVASNGYKLCAFRGISAPLAANATISGTLDAWVGGFYTGASVTAINTRLYVYVTVGDSNTVRGVLLDYSEPSGTNNWTTANAFTSYHLGSAQTLSSVGALAGDRIVCEVGVKFTSPTGTDNITFYYGTTQNGATDPALSATATDPRSAVAWIQLSQALTFSEKIRSTQFAAEIVSAGSPKIRASRFAAEAVYIGTPSIRLGQIVIETTYTGTPAIRLGQIVIEAIYPNISSAVISKSVVSNINVSQTIAARNTNVSISVITNCNVSVPESDRNTFNRHDVESDITVDSIVANHQDPTHEILTSEITVNQSLGLQSTAPHIAVTSSVAVNQLIGSRNNIVGQSVTSVVNTLKLGEFQAKARINSVRLSIFMLATVTSKITGGNSNREISVLSTGRAVTTARNNEILESIDIHPPILVTQTISGGSSNRNISITDSITVASQVGSHGINVDIALTQAVIVSQTAYGQGPIISKSVKTNILVNSVIDKTFIPMWKLNNSVRVIQTIVDRGDPNRRSIVSNSQVSTTVTERNTNVRLSVASNVLVTSKAKLDELIVRSMVSVTSKVNRLTFQHILQPIGFSDTVTPSKTFTEIISQSFELTDSANRNIEANRTIHQILVLPDDFNQRQIDTEEQVILVPVVIGVKVDKFVNIATTGASILLPAPKFEDSEANVNSIDIKRSITGVSYTHIKTSDRRKLSWPFKLGYDKIVELRQFMVIAISQVIIVTDWKGHIWRGYFTSNPFEFSAEARYANKREKIDVTLEFEATKIS